jgi:tRNA(fMet)-specific endonuclease VapC
MTGKYLLDTNIVIASLANDENVQQSLIKCHHVFVPSIVLGELYFGAFKSQQARENIQKVHLFALKNVILGCDLHTGKFFGEIKAHLQRKGTPIPENDIWIAAIAKQHEAKLITRDRHFGHVETIQVDFW